MPANTQSPIRILDNASIDRIAAGEVIERPASVVKELVENALDAGATSVRVTITGGGLTSISVEDDGHGIPFRELPLAFERHATSKIGSAADIVSVASFGFRGEALASIASVSRCTLVSRVPDEEIGGMIRIIGGETERREPAARNQGTTITVEDLFYNTPARRKFAKTPAAETKAVISTVNSIAMAYPDIRWRLDSDGTRVLDYLPADSLPARAREILGAAATEHMARFSRETGGLAIGGLASRPTYTRPNRMQQFVYVNRRPVKSRAISQAVQIAYREVIPPGRHPAVILFLEIPPGEVDVNVHPAKTEVRLMLERSIFGAIVGALQDGLDLKSASTRQPGADAPADEASPDAAARDRLAAIARAQDDYLRETFGASTGPVPASDAPRGQGLLFSGSVQSSSRPASEDPDRLLADVTDSTHRQAPFWQLHRTFICTQTRGGLVIIDQHNSHERILYNEAKQAMQDGSVHVSIQQLLFPVHLELTALQIQAFQANSSGLARLGFAIEPFGGQSIIVQGIPSSQKNWRDGELLLDILDDLSDAGQAENAVQNDLLASFACHGAIRAGAVLTVPEMQNLVDRLFATDLPLSCPHGRPTLIQFSTEELETRFGRR